jgi:hypothetical protein
MMDVSNQVLTATPKSGEYAAPLNQFFRTRTYVGPDYKNIVRMELTSGRQSQRSNDSGAGQFQSLTDLAI